MARGRMISKSLSTSQRFAQLAKLAGSLGEFAQSLFPLMVAHADDFGRLSGDAFTIKHLCHPTSRRSVAQFDVVIKAMVDVGLIQHSVEGINRIQINNFDDHQTGLHKRTASKFPEIPGNSAEFPVKRTEQKGTEEELKGREQKAASGPVVVDSAGVTARSKRPIFSGQRLTVFEWMFDDCTRTLGEYTDAFDLHEWFYTLDAQAVTDGLVLPKKDGGEWLQSQLVAEAQRRGLPLRMASSAPAAGKLTTRLASAIANIAEEDGHVARRIR